MSSRFVSGGKIDAETGESVAPASTGEPEQAQNSKGHAQWEAVQRELDAERKRREDARRQAVEGGEKTLYDVLQANKAAKQAEFEEQAKLSNQFRALDDDEIEFLDDVRERERREEDKVRMETADGLKAFREAQKLQEKQEHPAIQSWRRFRGRMEVGGWEEAKRHADGLKGVVKRKTSEAAEPKEADLGNAPPGKATGTGGTTVTNKKPDTAPTKSQTVEKPKSASPPTKPALGLGAYDSDDSD